MIPRACITGWRATAPWSTDAQVEQDLVLSRALVEIFNSPELAANLAFRGGTALHKLCFSPARRYSEDLDLVQSSPGPIGPVMDALHEALDDWLGRPQWKQVDGGVALFYRFESEIPPVTRLRLKVEINTREHFTVMGGHNVPFRIENPWFSGEAPVGTFAVEELLGTKLRALYQRSKGRDLFDLDLALRTVKGLDRGKIVECMNAHLSKQDLQVSRAEFEKNLHAKRKDRRFAADVFPLLASETDDGAATLFDPKAAFDRVLSELIALLPGAPWKGSGDRK